MATFKLVKQNGNRLFYALDGSKRSVRFDARLFPVGAVPTELEVAGDFVVAGPAAKATKPAEVLEAEARIKAFREQQKAEREARMTPEQRARRDERRAEAEAKREQARQKREQEKARKAAKRK